MKRHPVPTALLLLAGLPLASCGHSDPTRFWTLDPMAPTMSPRRAPIATAMAPLRVLAVRVPLAIDRLEVTEQTSANVVAVRDFDRWSAPLGELMRTALTQDLRARLSAGAVLAAREPKSGATRDLVVDVLDLQPTADGYLLEASWSVLPADAAAPIIRHDVRLLTPAGGNGAQAQAQAISGLIGEMADDIGAKLGSTR